MASLLSTKWGDEYSVVFVAVWDFLCFALPYSASKVHVLPLVFILGLLQWSLAFCVKILVLFLDGFHLVIQLMASCVGVISKADHLAWGEIVSALSISACAFVYINN